MSRGRAFVELFGADRFTSTLWSLVGAVREQREVLGDTPADSISASVAWHARQPLLPATCEPPAPSGQAIDDDLSAERKRVRPCDRHDVDEASWADAFLLARWLRAHSFLSARVEGRE